METHTEGIQEWCAILSIACVFIYILHNFQFQTGLDFFKFPPISTSHYFLGILRLQERFENITKQSDKLIAERGSICRTH